MAAASKHRPAPRPRRELRQPSEAGIGRPAPPRPPRGGALRPFLADRRGFTGAEKALVACFALAVIAAAGYLVSAGSRKAGQDAERTLASASGPLSGVQAPGGLLTPGSLPRAAPESSTGTVGASTGALRGFPEGPGDKPPATPTGALPPLQDPKQNPDPTNEYAPDATYKPVTGEVAVKGPGDGSAYASKDAVQGSLGNCYFIAMLAAQARANPALLENVVRDNGDGTYTVSLYIKDKATGKRTKTDIVVDNRLPHKGDSVAYAKPGDQGTKGPELWAALIEKAFAKYAGSYENIRGKKTPDGDVFGLLTGQSSTESSPGMVGKDALGKKLDEALKAGRPVSFGSLSAATADSKKAGVVANHAYSLESVNLDKGTVTLRNPWGVQDLKDLPIEDLQKFFPNMTIGGKGK